VDTTVDHVPSVGGGPIKVDLARSIESRQHRRHDTV
jgi:hypothetical protein